MRCEQGVRPLHQEAGPITVTAYRPGLEPVSVVIESVPFAADENGLTTVMPQALTWGVEPGQE